MQRSILEEQMSRSNKEFSTIAVVTIIFFILIAVSTAAQDVLDLSTTVTYALTHSAGLNESDSNIGKSQLAMEIARASLYPSLQVNLFTAPHSFFGQPPNWNPDFNISFLNDNYNFLNNYMVYRSANLNIRYQNLINIDTKNLIVLEVITAFIDYRISVLQESMEKEIIHFYEIMGANNDLYSHELRKLSLIEAQSQRIQKYTRLKTLIGYQGDEHIEFGRIDMKAPFAPDHGPSEQSAMVYSHPHVHAYDARARLNRSQIFAAKIARFPQPFIDFDYFFAGNSYITQPYEIPRDRGSWFFLFGFKMDIFDAGKKKDLEQLAKIDLDLSEMHYETSAAELKAERATQLKLLENLLKKQEVLGRLLELSTLGQHADIIDSQIRKTELQFELEKSKLHTEQIKWKLHYLFQGNLAEIDLLGKASAIK